MVVADILAQQFKQKISRFGGILSEKWPLEENHGATAEIVAQDGESPIVRQNWLGYQRFAQSAEVLGWTRPALLNCDKHDDVFSSTQPATETVGGFCLGPVDLGEGPRQYFCQTTPASG